MADNQKVWITICVIVGIVILGTFSLVLYEDINQSIFEDCTESCNNIRIDATTERSSCTMSCIEKFKECNEDVKANG
ncbi:MAG: hypothetical protein Q7R52_02905 [archaeon]|nr:hypothetical protein [archaeon]